MGSFFDFAKEYEDAGISTESILCVKSIKRDIRYDEKYAHPCQIVFEDGSAIKVSYYPDYPQGKSKIWLSKEGYAYLLSSDDFEGQDDSEFIMEYARMNAAFYYASSSFLSFDDYRMITSNVPDIARKFFEDPYCILDMAKGVYGEVPFVTFPVLANRVKTPSFAARLSEWEHCAKYILEKNEGRGNTFIEFDKFAAQFVKTLKLCGHPLRKSDNSSVRAITRYFSDSIYMNGTEEETVVALRSTFSAEKDICRKVTECMKMDPVFSDYNPDEVGSFSDEQMAAIKGCIRCPGRLSILTGGPGTGKTTVISKIAQEMTNCGYKVVFLAPTGMAGKRLKSQVEKFAFKKRELPEKGIWTNIIRSDDNGVITVNPGYYVKVDGSMELICKDNIEDYFTVDYADHKAVLKDGFECYMQLHIKASTIHKFLGYGRKEYLSKTDAEKKKGLFIIDEASMTDVKIFNEFLDAIDLENSKVILVGDVNQLPSISAGNLLFDLIGIEVPVFYLTKNFRSEKTIRNNALKVINGRIDFEYNDSFELQKYGLSGYMFAGLKYEGDIFLSPFKKIASAGSSQRLNGIVKNRLNPSEGFKSGDIVLVTRTNARRGYINGEVGTFLSSNGNLADVNIDGKVVSVFLWDLELGYSVSVHKSQGSEYDCVVLVIPKASQFITRRLLYTAITRAKNRIVIYSTPQILLKTALNNSDENRNTFLGKYKTSLIKMY